MAVPGAKRKPLLAAVREGTLRPDKHPAGARFSPADPVEPDWSEILPGAADVQAKAAAVWANTIPAVVHSAGLTDAQRETAIEYCIAVARIWQAERELSIGGMVVETERGMVKNPWITIVNQYRSHFRSLTGELGLSPSSAARITAPESGGDTDDVWD